MKNPLELVGYLVKSGEVREVVALELDGKCPARDYLIDHRAMKPRIVRKKGNNPLAELFQAPPSAESEATYRKLLITHRILELMEEKGVSRSELAARMGVQPSRVTAMLSGTGNLTIDTLVRAGMALDAQLHQTFVPAGSQPKRVPIKYHSGQQATARVAEDPPPYPAPKKP